MYKELSDGQLDRYSRQMIYSGFPDDGQEVLLTSGVVVVGLGGLGCTVASLLARAGVGYLILIDPDQVDLSNLHRQVLFDEEDIGRPKAQVAAEKIQYANSDVQAEAVVQTIQDYHAQGATLAGYSCLVVDCCDHQQARQAVADFANDQAWDVITGSAQGFYGQLTQLKHNEKPTFSDIYPAYATMHESQCERVGIIGTTVATIGALMAQEAIKTLLGVGTSLQGQLLLWDGVHCRWQRISL